MVEKALSLLILEDDPDDAELAVKQLEKEGINLKWNRVDTEEGFRKALTKKPDLILTDYRLPSFDGRSALQIREQIAPEIPLIIVSGVIGEDVAVECMKLGATDYVLKDSLSRLAPVVKRTIEEAKAYRKRKQAEEALLQSEIKYRTLVERLPAITYIAALDKSSTTLYISPQIEKILGISPTDYKADPDLWVKHLHPEDRERVLGELNRCHESGRPFMSEYRMVSKDGRLVWFNDDAVIVRDGKGKPLCLQGVMYDITERKQVEEALKQSEKKLWSILNSMTDFCYIVSKDYEIEFMNKALVERLGDQTGNICYKAFFDRESPCPWSKSGDVQKGATARWEQYLPKLESTFEIIDSPLINKDGTISKLGIWRDISKRKQAEQKLRETLDYLENLINHTNAPVIVWDPEFRITLFNNAFQRLTGYTADEVIGQELRMLFPEGSRRESLNKITRTLSGEYWKSVEIPILRKNGDVRHLLCNSANLYADNGTTLISTIVQGIDITQQKHLEAQLRQAQKMEAIGTLAGGIAHDFNNILFAVIGYTELALDKAPKETSLQSNLQEVLKAGHRAKDLVKQILTFSRQAENQLQPVQVKLIVKEALKMLRASLPTTIKISQNIQSDSMVLADPTQIHQVLINLCTNAAHAMRDRGGLLEVSLHNMGMSSSPQEQFGVSNSELEQDDKQSAFQNPHSEIGLGPGPYMKLTVSDTGHGMPPDVLERVFDPFFTTKEQGEGTGMGLSVVHGIIKILGGAITVNSKSGKGSTFDIYLPLAGRELKQEVETEKALPTGDERILFVDDEQPLAELGKKTLERLGYGVVFRTSSIEALELFRAQPHNFDMVITDMTMPDMTGEKLAAEIMNIRPDIPIILNTGYSEHINEERVKAMGIRALIIKPVVKHEMAETIRKVLDGGL